MAEEDFLPGNGKICFSGGELLGNYRIDGFTAFSSTGEIYSATDQRDESVCSLMVIAPALSSSSAEISARLLSKAQKACFFAHKNFVSIKETFIFSDFSCIVTEHIEGASLREKVRDEGPCPGLVSRTASAAARLLSALEGNAASINYFFTPDDVFITSKGEIKFLYPNAGEFFYLYSGSSFDQMPQLRENALYASRELLLGKEKFSFNSSLFSLGCVLYFMLHSCPPGQEENFCRNLALRASSAPIIAEAEESFPLVRRLLTPAAAPRTAAQLLNLADKGRKNILFVTAGALVLLCLALLGGVLFLKGENSAGKPPVAEKKETKAPPVAPEVEKKAPPAKKREILPPAPAPSPAPAPAPAVKTPAPAEEPLYIAARRLSKPQFFPGNRSWDERISHSRYRHAQLVEELANNLVAPGLVKLQQKKIEFRKQQIAAFVKAREQHTRREAYRKRVAGLAHNSELHKEVSGFLADCKSFMAFQNLRMQIMRKEKTAFPAEKLERADVDFNMIFELPALPAQYALSHRERGKTTLALLMLNGFLMPRHEAAAILANANVPLEGVTWRHWEEVKNYRNIPESVPEYLFEQIDWGNPAALQFAPYRVSTDEKGFEKLLLFESRFLQFRMEHWLRQGNVKQLEMMIAAELPLEQMDRDRRTPLIQAALWGQNECVKLLLDSGANPLHRDRYGKNAGDYKAQGELAAALREKNSSGVKLALEKGADVNFAYPDHNTPLLSACQNNDVKTVRLLIEKGADLNRKNDLNGMSPLAACFPYYGEKDPELFELLIQKGADITLAALPHLRRVNFLSYLTLQGRHRKCAPRFAEIMLKSGKFKTAPGDLFNACTPGSSELFRVMLKYWKDLNTPAYKPLFVHALRQRMPADIIKTMIDKGVPMPDMGQLRMFVARQSELKALFPQLAQDSSISDSDQQNRFGVWLQDSQVASELLKALRQEQVLDVERIIARGISPDSIVDGYTLLQHAVLQNSVPLINMLLRKKASPFKISGASDIPAVLAVAKGRRAAFQTLVRCRPMSENHHFRIFSAIRERRDASDYMRLFLDAQGRELKSQNYCYLTSALRGKVDNRLLAQLMGFYGDLSHPKHRAVVHQAVANGYPAVIIHNLLRRNAPVKGAEMVVIVEPHRRRRIRATVTQIADRVNSPRIIRKLLVEAQRRKK